MRPLHRISIRFLIIFIVLSFANFAASSEKNISVLNLDIKQFDKKLNDLKTQQEQVNFYRSLGGDFIVYAEFLSKLNKIPFDTETESDTYFFNLEFLNIITQVGSIHINELKEKIEVFKEKSKNYKLNNQSNVEAIETYLFIPSFRQIESVRMLSVYSPFNSTRYRKTVSSLRSKYKIIENKYWLDRYEFGLCVVSQLQSCTFDVHKNLREKKPRELEKYFEALLCDVKIGTGSKLILINKC